MDLEKAVDVVQRAVEDTRFTNDPEVINAWGVVSIEAAKADRALAELDELREAVRPALGYLDQHPGLGAETAKRLRQLISR